MSPVMRTVVPPNNTQRPFWYGTSLSEQQLTFFTSCRGPRQQMNNMLHVFGRCDPNSEFPKPFQQRLVSSLAQYHKGYVFQIKNST